MTTASQRTVQVLEQIVKPLPMGTNLALLHLMWAMISGAFLLSRGAVHPALMSSGFQRPEVRRSWRAMRTGQWHIQELLSRFRALVAADGQWQAVEYGGLKPVAVDLSAIWRPRLRGWPGLMFRRLAEKKMTGIGFGLIAEVGFVAQQRVPLLRGIVRSTDAAADERALQRQTLRQAARQLQEDEVAVHDAGVSLGELQAAGLARYIARQRVNITARRNQLPPATGRGRRVKFGGRIRPLPRRWKDRLIPASEADSHECFTYQGRTIQARGWHHLVRSDQPVSPDHPTFALWVFADPAFTGPWVLATNVTCAPADLYQLYISRWPVEQVPQVAKQLLGLQRQFVFHHQSCWRLGELAFLVGNILAWLAAVLPATATGYWDRHPKKRPVACAANSRAPFFHMNGCLNPNFAKSGRLRPIWSRGWPAIGGAKRPSKGRTAPFLAHIVNVPGSG